MLFNYISFPTHLIQTNSEREILRKFPIFSVLKLKTSYFVNHKQHFNNSNNVCANIISFILWLVIFWFQAPRIFMGRFHVVVANFSQNFLEVSYWLFGDVH